MLRLSTIQFIWMKYEYRRNKYEEKGITSISKVNELQIQCVECVEDLLNRETDLSRETSSLYDDLNKSEVFGYFVIHYKSTSKEVPTFITSLGEAFLAAEESLRIGFSFNQPLGDKGDEKYHVNVIENLKPNSSTTAATCYCSINESGARVSYIDFYGITDLSEEATLFQKGTAAHEYMHAITYTYRDSGELPIWFKEAWANWAAVHVQGIVSRNVSSVNQYLSNTYKSFKSDEYEYGKFLLPLYIGQNYGDIAVANVIKNLATTTNVDLAISNALPSGVTFQSIFPDFMGYNYAPKYFYTTYANGWSERPYISSSYTLNGYPEDTYGGNVNSYAAHYREFSVPTTTPYNLVITLRLLNNSGSLSGKLHMNSAGGVVTEWDFTTSGSFVTYSTTIGIPYVKGGMSITNTGTGQTGYHISIERN